MNTQELTAAINQLAEEVFHLRSNKAARELKARKDSFAREHHCDKLMSDIFLRTGAGDMLGEMLINFDDNIVPTMPKF